MEVKTKRILKSLGNWFVAVLVFAGMFCISISAGICAVVFSVIGFLMGYFNKALKETAALNEIFVNHIDGLLEGQTLVIEEDDEKVTFSIVEHPKPVKKKKNKKKENPAE